MLIMSGALLALSVLTLILIRRNARLGATCTSALSAVSALSAELAAIPGSSINKPETAENACRFK